MNATATLELPQAIYDKLQTLAIAQHSDPVTLIARFVDSNNDERQIHVSTSLIAFNDDPFFALINVPSEHASLIDNIPLSEDPDLYLVAAALPHDGVGLHAWEIAPQRYMQDEHGNAVRRK